MAADDGAGERGIHPIDRLRAGGGRICAFVQGIGAVDETDSGGPSKKEDEWNAVGKIATKKQGVWRVSSDCAARQWQLQSRRLPSGGDRGNKQRFLWGELNVFRRSAE